MAEVASTADGSWAAPVAARPAELARHDAVWHLYDRRFADMVRFAAFLTGDVHAAQDVAHGAFVRLLDAWDRIADPERADAYLKATIVNLVRGEHRRRETAARHGSPHLSLVASAEDDALGRAGRDSVLDAVSALPIRRRACVVMRYWMRMSETAITISSPYGGGQVTSNAEGKWGARIEFPGAPVGETFTVTITSSKGSAVYNFSFVSTRTV